MNENSSTKVNTIHMKAKLFQQRIPPWHRNKVVDSQLGYINFIKIFLLQSKINKKDKPSANGLVTTD